MKDSPPSHKCDIFRWWYMSSYQVIFAFLLYNIFCSCYKKWPPGGKGYISGVKSISISAGAEYIVTFCPFSSLTREPRVDFEGALIYQAHLVVKYLFYLSCLSVNTKITFTARILPYLEYGFLEDGYLYWCRPHLIATCLSVTINVQFCSLFWNIISM